MTPGTTPVGLTASPAQVRALEVERRFKEMYGTNCRIFRAPGRVNLIGEHTDYNDGFVMPAAIDRSCWIAISSTDSRTLHVHSTNYDESRSLDLDHPGRAGDWSDYAQGVALMLEKRGHHVSGGTMLISSDVPMGSGLSSSAALEVAVALALLDAQPKGWDRTELARMCQAAENEFVGARCGIMDQFIATHGSASHGLLLDCRSLEHRFLPIPKDVCLVICNTLVKHKNAAGEYNLRRAQCEEGVRLLFGTFPRAKALRDLSLQDLDRHGGLLPPIVYKRCRHVVSENQRVLDAAAAMMRGSLQRLGDLMFASHQSLRDDYEVSCPELDLLVELARQTRLVYGARMTGAGFGGCTINIVRNDAVAEFVEKVVSNYYAETGIVPEVYVCTASEGAGRWEKQ
jgi:galactokinase